MQQIRNARVFAPAQKRDLDIGAKTYSDIGLAGFRKMAAERARSPYRHATASSMPSKGESGRSP